MADLTVQRVSPALCTAVAVMALSACGTSRAVEDVALNPPVIERTSFVAVSDSLRDDPVLASLVEPYRMQLDAMTSEIIGSASVELLVGRPEGNLGNFVADAMLEETRRVVDDPIDFAITNNGGLRVPIPEGPITVGLIYELMPFENFNVVLTITGLQVRALADELAEINGEPVSGLTFRITEDGRAVDVRVGGQNVEPDRQYRVVTSNYLAFGGGNMPTLWEAEGVEQTTLMLRDSIIQYIQRMTREGRSIQRQIEGRIIPAR